jgi:hypothetical protein
MCPNEAVRVKHRSTRGFGVKDTFLCERVKRRARFLDEQMRARSRIFKREEKMDSLDPLLSQVPIWGFVSYQLFH